MNRSKKPKPAPTAAAPALKKKGYDFRDGLGLYLEHPEQNPEGLVVEYDDDFVVIQDKYAKASMHLLLLPRNPDIFFQHPLVALSNNPDFLSEVRKRVDRLKRLVGSELRRQYGQYSSTDVPYQSALESLMSEPSPPPPDQRDKVLPPGRDWSAEVIAGVHTHPSMNHLHIHILSRESRSPWMKHKKHYLSFHTSFFVGLDEMPLDEEKDQKRFHPGDWPNWDMVCWRCGENYRNKFAMLKKHLEVEFEQWKKE